MNRVLFWTEEKRDYARRGPRKGKGRGEESTFSLNVRREKGGGSVLLQRDTEERKPLAPWKKKKGEQRSRPCLKEKKKEDASYAGQGEGERRPTN